ncbi:MAG TPA: maleylpyruvate isomerase family mycothiol-dependent enzyme [Pseudonocardiaceae bacterium]
MSDRHELVKTLPWLRQGTTCLLAAVDNLTDDLLRAPSALPGWTKAHVVGHLARNAEALIRLANWAGTGVETPMYASRDQRAVEIEEAANLSGAVLRSEVATTARALDEAIATLDNGGWRATVRSALGRVVPATEIPWLRIREVWLHAIDLRAGVTVEDLPAGVIDLLLDDTTGILSGKDSCPAVLLTPSDRDRTWQLRGSRGQPASITAPAAELAGWLTGRIPGGTIAAHLPQLPTWL